MLRFILALILLAFCGDGWSSTTILRSSTAPPSGATNYTIDAAIEGYWMLEQATSSTAIDGSENDNDLTSDQTPAQTTTHVQGSYGTNYADGDYDMHFRTDANLAAGFPGKSSTGSAGSMSVGCWVNPATAVGGVISKNSSGDYMSFAVEIEASHAVFRASDSGWGTIDITGGTTLTVNGTVFYHIVGVFDTTADTISVYVNGTSDATAVSFTGDIYLGTDEFRLGTAKDAWGGKILDECFVMSKALSAAEVSEIYNHGLAGDR